MEENPFDARRRGTRRVRAVTASVAGAAVIGTGVAAVAVATGHPAQAATPSQSSTDPTAPGRTATGEDDGGFQQPAQPPGDASGDSGGFGSSGGNHASSGGS